MMGGADSLHEFSQCLHNVEEAAKVSIINDEKGYYYLYYMLYKELQIYNKFVYIRI